MLTRRSAVTGGAAALGLVPARLKAQAPAAPIRIGVLEDMSGVFSDLGGPSTVVAAQMAVEDFGGSVLGRKIEILGGDHQNKPDIGVSIAREWYDVQQVSLITGLTNSAVALGVQKLTADKGRINIVQNAATDALIEGSCSPNGIVWNWIARSIVKTTVEQTIRSGGRSWYFIVSDYAGGRVMEDEAAPVIKAAGGAVIGVTRPPVGQPDFASYLLSAQSSGAQILGVVTYGQDFANLLKQAVEFGVTPGMRLIAPFVFHSDLRAVGPTAVQGMIVAAPFYWDLNPETRAWSARFRQRTKRAPDVGHAGTYNAVTHYLKSVRAAGTVETEPALAAMRATAIDDMSTKSGRIRRDGMVEREIFLFEGKRPGESKDPWDLLRQIGTVPRAEAFPIPADPKCALLRS